MMEWIVTSTVLTALVIAARYALRGKISLRLQYGLWLLVLARLLIPVSFGGTAVSVANVAEPARPAAVVDRVVTYVGGETPDLAIAEPDPSLPEAVRKVQYEENEARWQAEMDAARAATGTPISVGDVLLGVWIGGGVVLTALLVFSNLRFGRALRRSRTPLTVDGVKLPVYQTEAADTPCLFGLFHPVIYVTTEASDPAVLAYAVAHEETHYRHGDHIWAALRCAALVLHWYNPLVWWAAMLSRRDGELSCDEATVSRLGEAHRADYGRTLLDLTCKKPSQLLVTATTMTGSAGSIKERIQLLVKRPRTTVGIALVVAALAAIAVGCTFTGAEQEAPEPTETVEETNTEPDARPEPAEPTEDAAEPVTVEQAARDWAEDVLAAERARLEWVGQQGPWTGNTFAITDAWVEALTEVSLGPEAADRGLHLYLLEYRLTTDEPEAVASRTLQEVENGQITERGRDGQPYLLLWENNGTVERIARLTTDALTGTYGSEALGARYGDSYTAASVLLLYDALGAGKTADLTAETVAEYGARLKADSGFTAYFPDYDPERYDATITFGAGWTDENGMIHLEFRASCLWPSVLMEALLDEADGTLLAVREVPGQWVSGTPEGTEMTAEELENWNAWMFARPDTILGIRRQFLTCIYRSPEEIDLSELFYNGCADGGYTNAAWTEPSEAEIQEVVGYEVHIGRSKTTTAEADACLRQYTGLGLEDTWQYLLESFTYSEKYDAYYHVHGDTNTADSGAVEAGWKLPDGSVRLRYKTQLVDNDELVEVALTPDGQGGWHFVYNLPVVEVGES